MMLFCLVLTAGILSSCSSGVPPIVSNRQLRESGNIGDAPGMFREPRGLSITPRNTILVTDFRNYRIQEIDKTGKALNTWGRNGTGPGQFNDPTMAVMDREGNIYVADTWNHRVQKYHADTNTWQADWAAVDFYAPRGITIDNANRVYVVNTSRHSIHVYRSDGERLAVWGNGTADVTTFHDPIGICTDTNNDVYVADCGNARIKIMDPQGNVLRLIHVEDWATDGFVEGYIDVDADGKIYATSSSNHKIIVYTPDGVMYSRFGKYGGGPEVLNYPTGIAVADNGNILITDSMNHRVVTYAPPPPIPGYATRGERAARILSAVRLIIDILALIIVCTWFIRNILRYTRKRRRTEHQPGAVMRRIQTIENHPGTVKYLMITAAFTTMLAMTGLSLDFLPLLSGILLLVSIGLFVLIGGTVVLPASDVFAGIPNQKRLVRFVFIGILLLAAFFRVYKLDEIPVGINNDAAWNGLYAHRILEGEPYTPFTSEAWGKSTLYFYLIALSFKLFGPGLYTLYLPCILAGVLTTFCLFYLCRRLFDQYTALFSALVYAVMAWNVTFSRTGYRAILAPLCLTLTGIFYYRAIDARKWFDKLLSFLACGFAIGLGLNTYFSFRGIPIMMIIIGIHSWITEKRFMRKNWWGLLILLTGAWTMFMPLFLYSLKHPDSFLGRSNFLFIGKSIKAAGSLEPVWRNLVENLQVFHYSADVGNFFDPNYAIVSVPLAFFLTIGFAWVLRHAFSRAGFWIMMTLFFGTLPGFLSEADAARNFMTTLPAAMCTGIGVIATIRALRERFTLKTAPVRWIWITAAVFGLLIAAGEYRLYFYQLARSYEAQFGYARIHTLVGRKALELSGDYEVYVSNSHFIDTPKFICHTIPGDVFAITNGREVDFITDDEIRDNLEEIKKQPRTGARGIAFVLDHCSKNNLVMDMIRELFPGIETIAFRPDDPNLPPEYYVMRLSRGNAVGESAAGD